MNQPGIHRSTYCLVLSLTLFVCTQLYAIAGETLPLIAAVKSGDMKKVSEILNSNESVSVVDKDGNTALHWAAAHEHDDLVRELIKHGSSVNATNRLGATPLFMLWQMRRPLRPSLRLGQM